MVCHLHAYTSVAVTHGSLTCRYLHPAMVSPLPWPGTVKRTFDSLARPGTTTPPPPTAPTDQPLARQLTGTLHAGTATTTAAPPCVPTGLACAAPPRPLALSLAWQPAADQGSPIQSYQLELCPAARLLNLSSGLSQVPLPPIMPGLRAQKLRVGLVQLQPQRFGQGSAAVGASLAAEALSFSAGAV